jgi:beta-mannosidase
MELEGIWTLTRVSDGSRRPIRIPGDIMSALIASGEVPDPYIARNESALQWIGNEDWLLERRIEFDPELLSYDHLVLDFAMIDTIAEIRINAHPVGTSKNMFRRFRIDAKPYLKPGDNVIAVLIKSAEREAAAAAEVLPYPIPHVQFPATSPHRNLVRKMQCMSGWDWGPCLMTGGIYEQASVYAIDGPLMEYVTTRVHFENGQWIVLVMIDLASVVRGARIEAELANTCASRHIDRTAGECHVELELCIPGASVERWQPLGYGPDPTGTRPLYELVVRCIPDSPDGIDSSRGHEIRKRIGFRELDIIAEPDKLGRGLTFRVNDRDVFCKGANWIPADALPSRWNRDRLDKLLSSAVEANMNCLRVWGGGLYESDDFYDLCDEKGILIWQDFAFACALYPATPEFLAEVEAEVRHQVKRLKDHACLALWCGNNENLGALRWFDESKREIMRYAVDYDRLYEGTIGRSLRELDPDRLYWPSSPCGGPGEYIDTWHLDGRGDMHIWSVWHEGKDFSEYYLYTPRFASEFGFQSFPNPSTVAYFAPVHERNVTSPVMEHHQRHPKGNELIIESMARYFRMPKSGLETLYLSQVQQSLAVKTAVEYWRSLRPICMGTLYWQLNDVWPASSWSSLDYDGSWKLLHYEARRFYDPILLSVFIKKEIVYAYLVNDTDEKLSCTLKVRTRRFDGAIVAEYSSDADAEAAGSTLLWQSHVDDLWVPPDEAFLEASVGVNKASLTRSAVLFLTEPKRCSLVDPHLEISCSEGETGPELLLRAAAPAFYVTPYIENERGTPGHFNDAGFHMMSGEERRITYRSSPQSTTRDVLDRLQSKVRVMHLYASYM